MLSVSIGICGTHGSIMSFLVLLNFSDKIVPCLAAEMLVIEVGKLLFMLVFHVLDNEISRAEHLFTDSALVLLVLKYFL